MAFHGFAVLQLAQSLPPTRQDKAGSKALLDIQSLFQENPGRQGLHQGQADVIPAWEEVVWIKALDSNKKG